MSSEHTTSTGHDISDVGWLDQHFNFAREAYEAMVRWVGFQLGWHVLDACCGDGSFLPLLAEQVGASGKLSALDLAPENIAAVEARVKASPLACAVEARVGNILSLPYADHSFDAVWNANVQQYLTDDELRQMLAELRRVTKPGGLVAIKEVHSAGWDEAIVRPLAFWRWIDAMCRHGNIQVQGTVRSGELPRRMRVAGLVDVQYRFFGLDKQGPLNANDREWRIAHHQWRAEQARQLELPAEDMAMWERLADAAYDDEQTSSRDYYIHAMYIQVVGRVP